jgi:hypothetical protein
MCYLSLAQLFQILRRKNCLDPYPNISALHWRYTWVCQQQTSLLNDPFLFWEESTTIYIYLKLRSTSIIWLY